MLFNTFIKWTGSVREKWRLSWALGKTKAEAEDYFSRVEKMAKRTPLGAR